MRFHYRFSLIFPGPKLIILNLNNHFNKTKKIKSAFEEAFNLYNQGIQLLITNKTIQQTDSLNIESNTDDCYDDKLNIDSGVESSSTEVKIVDSLDAIVSNKNSRNFLNTKTAIYHKNIEPKHLIIDLDNNNLKVKFETDTEIETETEEAICLQTRASKNKNPNLNNTGYCVDSVEPKCSELKRLIDEFKLNFTNKLNQFKNNKTLIQKLNNAKNHHAKGLELFNEQDLVNMSQERARQHLEKIDQWQASLEFIDLNNLSTLDNISTQSETDSTTMSSFDFENQSISSIKEISNLNDPNRNFVIPNIVVHKSKQSNLAKNFDAVCSQIRSLNTMFDRRKSQFRKSSHPTLLSKPMQRVEPQISSQDLTLMSASLNDVSSRSSSQSLKKRDSMNKV